MIALSLQFDCKENVSFSEKIISMDKTINYSQCELFDIH